MPQSSSVLVRATNQQKVYRALELETAIQKLKKELDSIKVELRREASLNLSVGVNEVTLHGAHGTQANIKFPRCSYSIDEDRVLELKAIMGDDFDSLIRVVHKAEENYHKFVGNIQGPTRGVLRSIVQPKPTTPRVTLGGCVDSKHPITDISVLGTVT